MIERFQQTRTCTLVTPPTPSYPPSPSTFGREGEGALRARTQLVFARLPLMLRAKSG
jgi:hypothetical protein